MYGLVNLSLQETIQRRYGDPAWEEIARRAGVEDEIFAINKIYDDDLTEKLINAASAVLGVPTQTILEHVGEHWILGVAYRRYPELMMATGESLGEFLSNLPQLHARVYGMFPNLKPPTFLCSDVTDRSLVLHYRSHRPGLSPIVFGLLRGLGVHFNIPVRVTQTAHSALGAEYDSFLTEWPAAPATRDGAPP
jgi:hypothetical protein